MQFFAMVRFLIHRLVIDIHIYIYIGIGIGISVGVLSRKSYKFTVSWNSETTQ